MNSNLIRQYQKLHQENLSYGTGASYGNKIINLYKDCDCRSGLDFGCGKGMLTYWLHKNHHVIFDKYDPAIPEYSGEILRDYDMVVANDVLEHLDPNCYKVDLHMIENIAKKVMFFNISCRLAVHHLPNGENCHTMLRTPRWWIMELTAQFKNWTLDESKYYPDNCNLILVYRKVYS